MCSNMGQTCCRDVGMNALELNADLWMRVFSHVPKGQLLQRVALVCKAWRGWTLSVTSRVLQAQIELPRDLVLVSPPILSLCQHQRSMCSRPLKVELVASC